MKKHTLITTAAAAALLTVAGNVNVTHAATSDDSHQAVAPVAETTDTTATTPTTNRQATEDMATQKPASQAEYDGNVTAAEADVTTAEKAAQPAAEAQADAQNDADIAQSKADEANKAVEDAKADLAKAQSDRSSADTDAETAQGQLDQLPPAADDAATKAAQQDVTDAQSDKTAAQSAVDDAQTKADAVDQTVADAESAVKDAQTAADNVTSDDSAVKSAQAAVDANGQEISDLTKQESTDQKAVDDASSAKDKADTAVTAAETAVTDAQKGGKTVNETSSYKAKDWPDSQLPAGTVTETINAQSIYTPDWNAIGNYFVGYLNELRKNNGLGAVTLDAATTDYAKTRVAAQAGNGDLSHDGVDNLHSENLSPTVKYMLTDVQSDQEYAYWALMGWFDETDNAYGKEQGWLHYGHRYNMLDPMLKNIGIWGDDASIALDGTQKTPDEYADYDAYADAYMVYQGRMKDTTYLASLKGIQLRKFVYTKTVPADASKVAAAKAALIKAQGAAKTAATKLVDAKSKLADTKASLAAAQVKTAGLKSALADAKSEASKSQSEKQAAADAALADAQAKLDETKSAQTAAQSAMISAKSDLDAASTKLDAAQKTLEALDANAAKRDDLEGQIAHAQDKATEAQKAIDGITASMSELEGAAADANAALTAAETVLAQANAELAVAEVPVNDAKALLKRVMANKYEAPIVTNPVISTLKKNGTKPTVKLIADSGKSGKAKAIAHSTDKTATLPQTGAKSNSILIGLGMALLALLGFGVAGNRRHQF